MNEEFILHKYCVWGTSLMAEFWIEEDAIDYAKKHDAEMVEVITVSPCEDGFEVDDVFGAIWVNPKEEW